MAPFRNLLNTAVYIFAFTRILNCWTWYESFCNRVGLTPLLSYSAWSDALRDRLAAHRTRIEFRLTLDLTGRHRGQEWAFRLGYIKAYDPDYDIIWHNQERVRLEQEALQEGRIREFYEDEQRIREEIDAEEGQNQVQGLNYQRLSERERGKSEHDLRVQYSRERSLKALRQQASLINQQLEEEYALLINFFRLLVEAILEAAHLAEID